MGILCPQDSRGKAGELPPGFEGGGSTQPHEPPHIYIYTPLKKMCSFFIKYFKIFQQTQFLQKNTKTKKNLCLSLKFASGARIQGSGGMSTIAPPDRFRIASHSTYKKENLVQNMKVKKNVHIILLEDSQIGHLASTNACTGSIGAQPV